MATKFQKGELLSLTQLSKNLSAGKKLALKLAFTSLGDFPPDLQGKLRSSVEMWKFDLNSQNETALDAKAVTRNVVQFTPLAKAKKTPLKYTISPPFTLDGQSFQIVEEAPFPNPNLATIVYKNGDTNDFWKKSMAYKFSPEWRPAFDARIFEFRGDTYFLTVTDGQEWLRDNRVELRKEGVEQPVITSHYSREMSETSLKDILFTKSGELFIRNEGRENSVEVLDIPNSRSRALYYERDGALYSMPAVDKDGQVYFGRAKFKHDSYTWAVLNRNKEIVFESPSIVIEKGKVINIEKRRPVNASKIFHATSKRHDIFTMQIGFVNAPTRKLQGIVLDRITTQNIHNVVPLNFLVSVPTLFQGLVSIQSLEDNDKLFLVALFEFGVLVINPITSEIMAQYSLGSELNDVRGLKLIKRRDGQIDATVVADKYERRFRILGVP